MRLEFGQPQWLWLLLPLAVHAVFMASRLRMLGKGRRITAAAIRLIVLTLLVGSLAGARLTRQSKELTVFFLVDESESVPETQQEFARAYVRKSLEEMGPNDRAGIIMFGADAAVERSPSRESEFEKAESVINTKGTNIADAIQLAMACFVGESQKRIVVLSDGNQTAGDAERLAETASAADVALDVVPLTYENRNDIILEKAVVDNRVSLDEPFDVRVIASTRQSGPATLTIMQDGKLLGNIAVELEADKKNVFVLPTQVRDAGFHTFEVHLQAEGDLIPENNKAFAFTFGEGEPRVLLVDGDAQPSDALAAVLQSEKISVDVTDPSGIPGNLRDFQNYDSVILNNVAANELSQEQMKAIEAAVHGLGMGFIMIGGENSFGPGGYNDSPIEKILPVDMEIKNEKILPQGALVTIIHTVEIPQGEMWAEKITQAALDVLSPQDLMGVLYYNWNGGEAWLFPLAEVGNKVRQSNLIKGIQPGDMPSFDATMQMAYDALIQSTASIKHVIVISDGDPATPNQALARKIKSAGITISTICIAPHSPRDSQTMQALAKWGGGNYYYPQQFDKLPQIFIKEARTVKKSLIFEEPFTPVSIGYSPLLPGIGEAYPILRGYVGTTAKSLADQPLVTEKADPLLASWQFGIGKTVAFTSDAKERWAVQWMGWEKFSKFWSQIIRWSLRPPHNPNYQVETTVDGAKGKIIVDAVDEAGEFKNFLNIGGKIISPSLNEVDVNFRQTSAGRYEAEFDANEPGTYMFSALSQGEDSDTKDMVTGGTSLSYSPEFQNSKSNQALLYKVAEVAGGRIMDETTPVFAHNLPSRSEPQLLWQLLLSIAMVLFLFDVFTRRVLIGWSEMRAGFVFATHWLREKYGWRRMRPGEVTATGHLLKVKETVRSGEAPVADERASFLSSLQQVKVDPSISLEGLKKGGPAPPPLKPKPGEAPKPASPEGEGSHTSQLLKARQAARKKMDKQL